MSAIFLEHKVVTFEMLELHNGNLKGHVMCLPSRNLFQMFAWHRFKRIATDITICLGVSIPVVIRAAATKLSIFCNFQDSPPFQLLLLFHDAP